MYSILDEVLHMKKQFVHVMHKLYNYLNNAFQCNIKNQI